MDYFYRFFFLPLISYVLFFYVYTFLFNNHLHPIRILLVMNEFILKIWCFLIHLVATMVPSLLVVFIVCLAIHVLSLYPLIFVSSLCVFLFFFYYSLSFLIDTFFFRCLSFSFSSQIFFLSPTYFHILYLLISGVSFSCFPPSSFHFNYVCFVCFLFCNYSCFCW